MIGVNLRWFAATGVLSTSTTRAFGSSLVDVECVDLAQDAAVNCHVFAGRASALADVA